MDARAIFDESLRLYPPVPAIQRKTLTWTTLGGLTLPADAIVLVGLYNLHQHPAFWPDPEQFCRNVGLMVNVRMPGAPTFRSAQDRVEPEIMVILRPKNGIRMTLQPRHKAVTSA